MSLDYTKSFIESQFPVSKLSKESYKERKSNLGQTLTGLGKWWGRKPLVLVRAITIASLLPVSDDPKKDRETFLKIMVMDDDGLFLRKEKAITASSVYEHLSNADQNLYFETVDKKYRYTKGISQNDKCALEEKAFQDFSYDEKIALCRRPEHIKELSNKTWDDINAHLETTASSIEELIHQLGELKFGHRPTVGDCFSGGGSNVFEPARLGCDVYGSDLNPISGLLTWADLNIAGVDDLAIKEIREFQRKVFDAVENQVLEWGIETNEKDFRANNYLYCLETICPECNYKVPLAPSWIIGKGTKSIAILKDNDSYGFDIEIKSGASDAEMLQADQLATIRSGSLYCPHCNNTTSISAIRSSDININNENIYTLRQWDEHDIVPRSDDIFTERLYCIQYIEDTKDSNGGTKLNRHYVAPSVDDLRREKDVYNLLHHKFRDWRAKGYLPSMKIERGEKTTELMRTRGWNYWHQLFNPRQLLIHGLFCSKTEEIADSKTKLVAGLLGINKFLNFNAKLTRWNPDAANEKGQDVFSNQALNTMYNYCNRGLPALNACWFYNINNSNITGIKNVELLDARNITRQCDIWITDPPYADAVSYHELSEFFLAWDKVLLKKAFPEWYTDSKRALAIKGVGKSFNESMVEVYKNLADHMSTNGVQIVMFTHQDTKVWAELAMILWSAGLRVTAAWCIATETESGGLKQGNYVKGTVLMVLRKQTSEDTVFNDELYEEIRSEVKSQIDSMRDLDDKDDPDFNDGDYLLAAYVAALKVLTSYKEIEGIDVQYELTKARENSDESPVTKLINIAKREAYDYLVPTDIDSFIWRELTPGERFYLKGIEVEINGSKQLSAYQELARGFGIKEYRDLLESTAANKVRLKTPTEFKTTQTGEDDFGTSLLRQLMIALYLATKESSALEGRNYLKSRYADNNEYWMLRTKMIALLSFLSKTNGKSNMPHWSKNSEFAAMLKEAIKNDSI